MESLDYSRYMRRALQRLVGDVLGDVAIHGLPGDHHFYISFLTQMPGVQMPNHLRKRYPNEMTIVLQGWFDNLGVMGDRFAVTLSFNGVAEELVVPFDAILGFADPSVDFNLRLEASDQPVQPQRADEPNVDAFLGSELPAQSKNESPTTKADVIQLDKFRK